MTALEGGESLECWAPDAGTVGIKSAQPPSTPLPCARRVLLLIFDA